MSKTDHLKIAALFAGTESAMASIHRNSSYLNELKRTSWSETDLYDFQISAILLMLVDISICTVASRETEVESIDLSLGYQRVQKMSPK